MKLYYAPASPFARKAHATIIELEMQDNVELIFTPVAPGKPNEPYIESHNPLGKIPALQLDSGTTLCDSTIICEYLDSISTTLKLLPESGAERYIALSQQALAHGICESAVTLRYETFLRPDTHQWDVWIADHWGKIERVLTWFNTNEKTLQGKPDLTQITLGCALGYLDFRSSEYDWRSKHSSLKAWYEKISQRDSFRATQPTA